MRKYTCVNTLREREKHVCAVSPTLTNVRRSQGGVPLIFSLHTCKRRKMITTRRLTKIFRKTSISENDKEKS